MLIKEKLFRSAIVIYSIASVKTLLNLDHSITSTRLIWPNIIGPLVTVLKEFNCNLHCGARVILSVISVTNKKSHEIIRNVNVEK